MAEEDAFAPYDRVIELRGIPDVPWLDGDRFEPDIDLLSELLSVPIEAGKSQASGALAKAFDMWIAHELRRAGFPPGAVWPRARRPRVLPDDLEPLELAIAELAELADTFEPSEKKAAFRKIQSKINKLNKLLPGSNEAYILGDFYAKQVDVSMSSWRRGPDILISSKTMTKSFRKNLKNRHEEAVGEALSLRARHPMAVLGYAYLVHTSVYDEDGAFAILQDILLRLRRLGVMFDASMVLVAEWDLNSKSPSLERVYAPEADLNPQRFFEDVVDYVLERSPVSEHTAVRRLRNLPTDDELPPEGAMDIESIDDDEERGDAID